MITLGFVNSIEFYVICVVVAAAVIALFIRPSSTGEAMQFLLASRLSVTGDTEPSIELTVKDDFTVTLIRHGLRDINSDGAVSLVVNVAGTDIAIEERLTSGRNCEDPVDTATFKIDFLRPGQYHLRYESVAGGGLFAATPLRVRPEIHIVKPLTT